MKLLTWSPPKLLPLGCKNGPIYRCDGDYILPIPVGGDSKPMMYFLDDHQLNQRHRQYKRWLERENMRDIEGVNYVYNEAFRAYMERVYDLAVRRNPRAAGEILEPPPLTGIWRLEPCE